MTITVPGLPIAQPRQRHRVVNDHAQNYTPSKHPVNAYKATIRLAYKEAGGQLHEGPVQVAVELYFPRPKSLQWKTREWTRTWHTAKPDCENCAKAVLDSLSSVAFADDRQVALLTVMKFVCGREEPRTVLRIAEIKA